jgi:hypothetical protein
MRKVFGWLGWVGLVVMMFQIEVLVLGHGKPKNRDMVHRGAGSNSILGWGTKGGVDERSMTFVSLTYYSRVDASEVSR